MVNPSSPSAPLRRTVSACNFRFQHLLLASPVCVCSTAPFLCRARLANDCKRALVCDVDLQGILLVGSGEVVHNVPDMGARSSLQKPWCLSFETWIERTAGVATETASRTTAATTTTVLRQLDRHVVWCDVVPPGSQAESTCAWV